MSDWSHMTVGVRSELSEYEEAYDRTGNAIAAAILVLATRVRQAPEWLAHEAELFKTRHPDVFEPPAPLES